MDAGTSKTKNTEKTKYTALQESLFNNLDLVEAEILEHQKAIEALEVLYLAMVQTLKSPFISEGNLSQMHLSTKQQSPEAQPPADRRGNG